MKAVMAVKFKACNPTNHGGKRSQAVKYIVIHYTANNGDTAKNNADYFANNKNLKASAHYFVDENEVWQSVDCSYIAWHCGGALQGSGGHKFYGLCTNSNSIGVEMCSRKDSKGVYYIKEETLENAAELVRGLMATYNVPIERVIRHYDVTGKGCPQPLVDENKWKAFKDLILRGVEVEKQIKIKLNGTTKTVNAIEKNGFNYVKLQDLRDNRISIEYDGTPIVRVVDK